MSLGLWPEAVPFDPDSESALDALRKNFQAANLPGAVLLVPARSLRGSAWAPQAAIGLARALAGDRPVVLVDLDFERPTLHPLLNEPNGEGVADALLFGASLERVTVTPAGERFEFVPAGAYAPGPDELMAHPGWTRVLAELAARNAILLAYAPVGARGLDAITERIAPIIVLAEEIDVTQTVALLPEMIRVEGVIRPGSAPAEVEPDLSPPEPRPVPPPPEPLPVPLPPVVPPSSPPPVEIAAPPPPVERVEPAVAAEPPPPPAPPPLDPARRPKEEAREALAAELRARQAATAEPAPPEQAPPAPQPAPVRGSAPPPRTESTRRRFVSLLGMVAAIGLIAWIAGRLLAGGRTKTAGAGTVVTRDGPPEPAGEILGFSIAIESYDRLAPAMARADSLGLAQPGISFYIAPFDLDSVTYFRVLAGPLVDSASATATMQALVARGLKTAATADDVRSTPLTFELGRFDTREEAEQQMMRLRGADVPSYIVEVPYTQGPPRFHLYAGAYSGPSEAAVMRDVLRGAGIADTLVLRVGRITP